MDDNAIPIVSGIISVVIIGALIWAFIKFTKIALLILLGLVLLCIGIGIFIAVYDKYGPGFKTVGEQKLQKRAEDLIVRIRRCRRFSSSTKDALANSYAEQLLQLANDLLNVINKTPDSAGKTELITQRTDELERAVEKLEQLNLTTAMTDAGQLQSLEEDFRLTIEAMQSAQAAVSGQPMQPIASPLPEKQDDQQFYSSQQ